RYKDDEGRVLTLADLRSGQVTRFRFGRFTLNFLLNAVFLGLWFVCLWLLLRFQWAPALGLALGFWAVKLLAVGAGGGAGGARGGDGEGQTAARGEKAQAGLTGARGDGRLACRSCPATGEPPVATTGGTVR